MLPAMGRTTMTSNSPVQSTKYASYLMTPEEQAANSFAPEYVSRSQQQQQQQSPQQNHVEQTKLAPIHGLASPPTSPEFGPLPAIGYATGYRSPQSHPTPIFDADRPLFSVPEVDRAQPDSPLFRSSVSSQDDRAISTSPPARPREPQPDSVAFTLSFPFNLDIRTKEQAWDYWKGCCADASRLRRFHLPVPQSSPTPQHRDPVSIQQLQSIERNLARQSRSSHARSQRPTKTAPAPERTRHATSTIPRRVAKPKQQHAHQASMTHTGISSPPSRIAISPARSPDEKAAKHRRAPASKPRPIGENWSDIPDYCPPLSSLDTAPRPLRARPVGSSGPLDLSRDPDREHLHPDELAVASTLRLQCAKYLLNKRKIFKAKYEHLQGTSAANFNKTEAQKACTIDVNKASSLYAAFEEVGWFRSEWFEKYM